MEEAPSSCGDLVALLKEKGAACLSAGRMEEAMRFFSEAIALDPDNRFDGIDFLVGNPENAVLFYPQYREVARGIYTNSENDDLYKASLTLPTTSGADKEEELDRISSDDSVTDEEDELSLLQHLLSEHKQRESERKQSYASLPLEKKQVCNEKSQGKVAYRKKNFGTALDHFRKAVELDPTDMTSHNYMATVYLALNEYQTCIDQATKAIEVGRKNAADYIHIYQAYFLIGRAYMKLQGIPIRDSCEREMESLAIH